MSNNGNRRKTGKTRELSRAEARRRREKLLCQQQAASKDADRREQESDDATVAPFVLPGGD